MELAKLKTARVLVVEDDEEDYFILSKVFGSIPDTSFRLTWINDYSKAAKEVVKKNTYDVFLIDYRLGEQNGLDLLKLAKAGGRTEPFILLTGQGDPDIEWRSMRLAASDFLIKGTINRDVLSRSIYYAFERKNNERQRVQELVELNRSKDEFISIASHQLRTPATAVKQYLGMLIEGFMGDMSLSQRAVLQKAYASNERQLSTISELLRVAQVDAGYISLKKTDVNINAMIEQILTEVAVMFDERQQQVVFRPDKTHHTVCVDERTFHMVLENLIDNASKYSQDGTKIEISVQFQEKDVLIHISDHGVGISKDQLKQLFGKFSRIPNELSTERGGTGLGLYWAKQIIDMHSGKISVESKKGTGTTFTISLPK